MNQIFSHLIQGSSIYIYESIHPLIRWSTNTCIIHPCIHSYIHSPIHTSNLTYLSFVNQIFYNLFMNLSSQPAIHP